MAKQQATSTETMLYGVSSHIGGRPNLEDRVALSVLGEGWFPRRRANLTGAGQAA